MNDNQNKKNRKEKMKKEKKKKQPGAATFVSREDIYSWLTLAEKLKVGSDRR